MNSEGCDWLLLRYARTGSVQALLFCLSSKLKFGRDDIRYTEQKRTSMTEIQNSSINRDMNAAIHHTYTLGVYRRKRHEQ